MYLSSGDKDCLFARLSRVPYLRNVQNYNLSSSFYEFYPSLISVFMNLSALYHHYLWWLILSVLLRCRRDNSNARIVRLRRFDILDKWLAVYIWTRKHLNHVNYPTSSVIQFQNEFICSSRALTAIYLSQTRT